MKAIPSPRSQSLLSHLTLALALGAASVSAADRTWDGEDATPNWSAALNWDGDTAAPVNGDNLIFDGFNQPANNNDLAGLALGWLRFDASSFDLSGQPLTLSSGITNTVGASGATLNNNLTLGASQSFASEGGTLAFTGIITNGVNLLTLQGDGSFSFGARFVGSGGSGIIKNGAGTVTLTNYTGSTIGNGGTGTNLVINGGVVEFSSGYFNASPFGHSALNILVGGSGTLRTTAAHSLGGDNIDGGTSWGQVWLVDGGTLELNREQYLRGGTQNGLGRLVMRAGNVTGTFDLRSVDAGGTISTLPSATSSTISASGGINVRGNLTLDVADGAAADDLVITSDLKANTSGGIIKTNTGRLVLQGYNNNYVGNTVISAGTLALTGAILNSSTINVAGGAIFDVTSGFMLNTNQTLAGVGTVIGTVNDYNNPTGFISPGGNNTAGTLTIESLNLSGNLAFNLDLANTLAIGGGTNDLLVVTNFSASAGQTNLVNFSFLSGTPALGTYTIIRYINPFGGDASQFLKAVASRYTYTFTNDTAASAIRVIVAGSPAPLVWKGDGVLNAWDINTTANWTNVSVLDYFLQGDNVTFNDVGSTNPPVNIIGNVQPNNVTVNATKDYTLAGSGKITGSARLLKSNSGNLTLLTENDFTGGGSLNGAGVVNVGAGGATGNLGGGNLTNNTRVTFNRTTSATYPGNMSGSGSLISFTPGATLTLTGTNTFTGGLTVQAGTLQIGNANVASVTGNITNYGTLNLYRSDAFTNQNLITSAGNTLTFGNGDINVRGAGGMTVNGAAGINTLPAGALSVGQSQPGKLTVDAGGLITLGGSLLVGNPNVAAGTGTIIQNGGTINVGNQMRLGHWSSEVSYYTMNGGTLNVPNSNLGVGWDGIGLFMLNGGTVNARTLNVDDNGFTGAISGTNSVFTMTGGQLNIGSGGIGGSVQTNTSVNNIRLSGGTIAAVAPAGFSSTMSMILTNGTPTFDTASGTVTLSGTLSGNGGLTKQGAGSLNLNGTNTYQNTTTVAAGTLQGTGSLVSPVTVQSGATLSAGATAATGTLTLSNATVNAGGTLHFDASSTAATSDLIFARGTLALGSPTLATFNFLGGKPFTGAPYTVVSNLGIRSGNLVLAPTGLTRYTPTLDETNPNRIQVSFTGTNAYLAWRGDVNNLWNVNTDSNWRNAGVADKYFQSDAVLFDDSGIVTPNVSLAATMTPASVMVNASGHYSFSGAALAGSGTLTKNGTGMLTVSNDLAHTGGTWVNSGMLRIGNGGTTGSIVGNIVNQSSVVFNRSDTVTYPGVISGSGTLTQAGTGTLLITGTQAHYGGTTVNPGSTVQLGNGVLADSGALGNGTVMNNGTVIFNRAGNVGVATPYAGAGNFIFNGTGVSGQGGYVMNATNTFTGPVTLNLARLQSGAGAQSFGSPSIITVNPGSAVYAVATPASPIYSTPLTLAGTGWQDGLGALRMEGNGTWAGNITLAANARIATTSASTNTVTGTISGNYELETTGNNAAGAVVLAPASANTYNALRVSIGTAGTKTIAANDNAIPNNIPLTMNGGTLWLNGFSKSFSSFVNLNGNSSIQNGSTTSPATVTLAPALGSSSYNGTFADGASQPLNVTFTQTPGLWTLALATASPNWSGNLTNNGGTITVGAANILGNQATLGRHIVGNSGAVFVTTINNALNGYNGSVTLNKSTWINNRYVSFAPAAGSLTLVNSTINGTNATDGASFQSMRLPSTVNVSGSSPSSLLGLSSGTGYAGYGLATSGDTTFNVADVTGNTNSDLIVGQVLYGGSGQRMIKAGMGTLELSGANTYSGPTLINGGTVSLTGSGSLAFSPTISIAAGATLDVTALGGLTMSAQTITGSGTVKGNLSDGPSSVIRPGTSAGTLTVNGNLSLNGSGSLAYELANVTTIGGGVNDFIQVNGDLSLANTPVNFTFLNGAPAAGTYTIMKYTGTLTGDPASVLTAPGGYTATFSHNAGAKEIRVTFSVPAQNLVWQGDGGGNTWDLETSSVNWSNSTTTLLTNFYQLDTVRFDDSSVNTTVDIAAAVNPVSITLDSASDYTLQGGGKITGNTTITKNNANTVTLSTLNDFTGPVNITGGVLKPGVGGIVLPVGATVTVSSGGAYDFAGQSPGATTRGYSFNIAGSGPDGNGAINNTGAAIFGNASVSNVTLTANATVGGANRWDLGTSATGTKLDGGGNHLTKTGAMTMSMRPQTITNLASLTVAQGAMYYENFDQTNAWTASTTNFVKEGAALGNYGRQINVPVVLEGGTLRSDNGTATWLGPVMLASNSIVANNLSQILGGVVSGPGEFLVTGGTGVVSLTNANTWTGGLVLSNGFSSLNGSAVSGSATLLLSHPSALGSGPLTLHGGAVTTDTITNTLRAVEFNLTGGALVPNDINLPTSLITNVSLVGRDANSVFTLAGKLSGGHPSLTNWLDNGAGNVGVLRLSNPANDFVVGRTLLNRGTLALAANGVLGNPANPLHIAGTVRFDAAGLDLANPVAVVNTSTLQLLGDNNGDGTPETVNNVTLSGVLSGGGLLNFRGTNGVVTLTGNNLCSGSLELVEPVTLQVAASTNLGTSAVALKAGTLRYTGTGAETMTRTLWNDNAALSGATIDITSPAASLTWNPAGGTCNQVLTKTGPGALTMGTLALNGSLNANGGAWTINSAVGGATTAVTVNNGATLLLNGNNTYAFPTLVNSGTLFVNGTTAAGSPVTVAGSSILGGTGTINGQVVVNAGANLQPGTNSIGTLTINNALSLAGTTTMEINPGGSPANDSIAGLISVVYGGTLNVNNLGSQSSLILGSKFTLFSSVVRLGSFSALNLPPLDSGLAWQNNLAVDGSIEVVSTGSFPPPATLTNVISGNQLTLSWPAGEGWRLFAQTNSRAVGVTMPTNTWVEVAPASSNTMTFTIEKTNPTVFFRLVYP